ncbi:MAG: Txe/YoeB family addiction module toxin [Clostridia bacterium]|nr:Txe/YoeB family addiction module toxin [Clostridia bacterium]
MRKIWTDEAWDDYLYWQQEDRKTLKRINALIRDAERSPYEGIGKPEPLQYEMAGLWSRRIDEANRLVYRIRENCLEIVSCRGHYN